MMYSLSVTEVSEIDKIHTLEIETNMNRNRTLRAKSNIDMDHTLETEISIDRDHTLETDTKIRIEARVPVQEIGSEKEASHPGGEKNLRIRSKSKRS